MQFGLIYPQTEFGSDPIAIRDYVQTSAGLGFSHIVAYDHVLGANPDRPGWQGPYTYLSPFLEPLVLFAFMASVTTELGFFSGILILPQRQTALVAKQAATLDLLCAGRLRLGVGVGWNEVEYIALNQDFHTRGQRIEEQVRLLRQLWTQELVDFTGHWDTIPDAGINPLPPQRPIPIWFGGHSERALRRAAEMGDGWVPSVRSCAEAIPSIDRLKVYLERTGRETGSFGLEGRLAYGDGNTHRWVKEAAEWKAAGASHLSLNTMNAGFRTPGEHIAAIKELANVLEIKKGVLHAD
jgi:probable F420-dependent oxidoreductase